MVLSTSQQGLGKVVAELKLGPNDVVSTFCVNPEKEVASEIFDRLVSCYFCSNLVQLHCYLRA